MKVIHTESSLGWGGQEIRILTEMAGMIRQGHQMHLLCPATARIHAEAIKLGIPVDGITIEKKRLPGLLALRRKLKNLKPDLVVTHSSTDSWLAAIATQWWGKAPPIVRVRHISAPVRKNTATRWLYASACKRVVTTGEKLRQELIRDLNLDPKHVISIPTGIDLSRYAPGNQLLARQRLGLPESGRIIGIVATLRSWKGHRYLLDAFAKLADANVHLLVVGDGPGRDNLRQQAKELGIESRLSMPGNQSDVVPWLTAMDVFVLPSYANEGVPQGIMQAMACGLPVISTPVGSIPEIIEDGITGLLIPPRNTEVLADALGRLLGNDDLRHQLSQAALEQARRRFGDAIMLERMIMVFREVTA